MPATRLFDRAVIRLSAPDGSDDVAEFLQGLVTNDVTGALPVWAGLLNAQGKAMFDFIVWHAGKQELLLDCEANAADDLVKRLSIYRLRRKITIERDPDVAVHWQPDLQDGGTPDPRLKELGQRWLASAAESNEPADAAWRAHRLSMSVAEGRADLGDILWLETNAAELNGVSFTKGCYIGQENTARMNWRQKVNRRLLVVPIDRSNEKRRKAAYPDLGLALDHLRVDDIPPDLVPFWLNLDDTRSD